MNMYMYMYLQTNVYTFKYITTEINNYVKYTYTLSYTFKLNIHMCAHIQDRVEKMVIKLFALTVHYGFVHSDTNADKHIETFFYL